MRSCVQLVNLPRLYSRKFYNSSLLYVDFREEGLLAATQHISLHIDLNFETTPKPLLSQWIKYQQVVYCSCNQLWLTTQVPTKLNTELNIYLMLCHQLMLQPHSQLLKANQLEQLKPDVLSATIPTSAPNRKGAFCTIITSGHIMCCAI